MINRNADSTNTYESTVLKNRIGERSLFDLTYCLPFARKSDMNSWNLLTVVWILYTFWWQWWEPRVVSIYAHHQYSNEKFDSLVMIFYRVRTSSIRIIGNLCHLKTSEESPSIWRITRAHLVLKTEHNVFQCLVEIRDDILVGIVLLSVNIHQ